MIYLPKKLSLAKRQAKKEFRWKDVRNKEQIGKRSQMREYKRYSEVKVEYNQKRRSPLWFNLGKVNLSNVIKVRKIS